MSDKKITRAQKELLAPFEEAVEAMYSLVEGSTDNDLEALRSAAEAASQTNCTWATYRAAEIVSGAAAGEMRVRKRRRAAA